MDPFDNKRLIQEFCYENDLDFDFWIAEANEKEFLKFTEEN